MSPSEPPEPSADVIELYRRTVESLYRYVARRSAGSRELAEDITQETYLRAVEKWRNGQHPDNAIAWLQTVARNLLVNHYRRRSPDVVSPERLQQVLSTDELAGPDASGLVCWGLGRLGKRSGALLEAFHLEGKSTRTIAGELGISERAVEGRLRRARQELRTHLERSMKTYGE